MTPIIFQPICMKFAFPKHAPKSSLLVGKINAHMEELRRNGHSIYYRLLKRYFETPIAEKRVPVIPGWLRALLVAIAATAAAALLVILFIVQWNRSLKSRVIRVTDELRRELKERREAEERVRKLNRIYAVLSNINQAIVRLRDMEALLQEACRIAVEDGGFRMAWIGKVDGESDRVEVVSCAGHVGGYLDNLDIDLGDPKRMQGPTGRALLSVEHVISSDIEHDEAMHPWRKNALEHGFRSSAAFPITVFGRAWGTFNLYADEPFFFDEDEIKLLDELALDLSFALEFMEHEGWLNEMEAIINKSPVVVFLWRAEKDWPVEYVSENVSRFGYGVEDFSAGKTPYARLIHPGDLQRVREEVERYCAEGVAEFSQEYRIITGDGQVRWTEVHTWLRRDRKGKITHYQGIVQDVTAQKEAERELEQSHHDLERKVAERTRDLVASREAILSLLEDVNESRNELAAANEKLKELDRLKSMFIASMSHEFRTPLNSIIGFSSILLQGLAGELNDEQRDQLRRVHKAGKHLLSLITDVIDVSRIEAGKTEVHVTEFDLYDLLSEAASQLKDEIAQKGLDLQLAMPDRVKLKTDRRKLLQCVLNFLSNAAKFTERGSLRLETETLDGMVEIRVIDSGIGIADEDIPRLFQSFVRLDSPLKTKVPGTGLGLYLTRKIAEEVLQGTVFVESRPGRGSTFGVRVPKTIPSGVLGHPGGDER